jgi:hypothetical protein
MCNVARKEGVTSSTLEALQVSLASGAFERLPTK